MALDTKHPLYLAWIDDWQQMRDSVIGERIVKERAFTYLPATAGMVEDGAENRIGKGWSAYESYRKRARFPDWVRETISAALGVMHAKPPVIELPPQLESIREFATSGNESLEMLLQRVNEEQLALGRVGLFADIAMAGKRRGQPYLSLYFGEDIINWDAGSRTQLGISTLNLVVLNESQHERTSEFEWELKRKFRTLVLGEVEANEPLGVYQAAVFNEADSFNPTALETPTIRGRSIDEIPFVFVNSADVVPEPYVPPLIGLSNLAMSIYRGDADYRQSLFMQGQDTLVVVGRARDDDDIRVGAHARLDLPIGGDAKYVGVDSSGLPEQRLSLENDNRLAMQMSGTLLDSVSRQRESAEALTVRVAAKTATLTRIALAGAFGLERLLRIVARWEGADPDAVVVQPNLDFTDDQMTGQDLAQWMGAKSLGAPISVASIHRMMQDKGATELTLEEEVAKIEQEQKQELAFAGSSNPDGPEDDPGDDGNEGEET